MILSENICTVVSSLVSGTNSTTVWALRCLRATATAAWAPGPKRTTPPSTWPTNRRDCKFNRLTASYKGKKYLQYACSSSPFSEVQLYPLKAKSNRKHKTKDN